MRGRRGDRDALDRLKYDVAQEIGMAPARSGEEGYQQALERRKEEVAEELGLTDKVQQMGWGEMTARDCGRVGGYTGGRIGGQMVKRMLEYAEKSLGQQPGGR